MIIILAWHDTSLIWLKLDLLWKPNFTTLNLEISSQGYSKITGSFGVNITPLSCLCPILECGVPRGAESGCHSCSRFALPVHQDQHADRQETVLDLNEGLFVWMVMFERWLCEYSQVRILKNHNLIRLLFWGHKITKYK